MITERRRTARKCLVTSKAILPHNVKAGVQYPATMVTTGDHDDRVVPAHSFKFAAELQENKPEQKPKSVMQTDRNAQENRMANCNARPTPITTQLPHVTLWSQLACHVPPSCR
jgi:hypothetical protein